MERNSHTAQRRNVQGRSAQNEAPRHNANQDAARTPGQTTLTRQLFGFLNARKWKDSIAQGGLDVTFFMFVVILLTVGLVMMFSASYVYASYVNDNPYHYISRQLLWAGIGLVAMFAISKIRYTVYKDFAFSMLLLSLGLLVYALINPDLVEGKEEFKRWIAIPFIGTNMQPSEVAKIGLILFCAWSMERQQRNIEKKWWMMIPYASIIGVMCGLVFLENHLSGTILMLAIGGVMTFLGGVKFGWYLLGGIVLALVAVFIALNPDFLKDYAGERIEAWLNEDFDPKGARWQINQSLYAIGSGGLFGAGLGESKQKHLYIPEPQNDFVFAVVCEELGFIGAMFIIVLFVLLVWRGFVIALRAKDRFSSLLVMGICFQVGLQAALNIAVVTGTIPNTGISLPFFSYGGTSLLMLMAEMGMVLSVSRYSKLQKL